MATPVTVYGRGRSIGVGDQFLFDYGTTALPGVAFNGDEDTGLARTAADSQALIVGAVQAIRMVQDTWGASSHLDELSATPTAITDMWAVYGKTDNNLYFQDGAGVEHSIGGQNHPAYKSYTFAARSGASGEHFQAGFYDYAATDADLTNASLTQTHGTANSTYAAHAFIVSSGNGATNGSDLVLTVSGTSITDAGARSAADSEVIEATAAVSPINTYFETTKKWIGQVTFTLSSAGGTTFNYTFNYGLAKYEDFGNRNFTLTDVECVGLANANDSGFNVEILHHKSSGWTYHATAFVAGSTALYSMATIHGSESDLIGGEHFAFKRTGLSDAMTGNNGEGLVVRVTTTANAAVSYMDTHIGVNL